MIPQAVLQLAHFCKEVGLFNFVVSPGSRSAPLVLALSRIGGINLHIVADERSAGFIALGMAMGKESPVGLLCTSGTAVLNYAPAIAEAFYQQVPLFVITADRPPEWIDQNEGQAIRQNYVFQQHTKFSSVLPSLDESQAAAIHTRRLLNQAWYEATQFPKGPVHLNVPLREPLYPTEAINFQSVEQKGLYINLIQSKPEPDRFALSALIEKFNSYSKRLVVVGQSGPNRELRNSLTALADYGSVPILGDCIHNLNQLKGQVSRSEWFTDRFWSRDEIQPELLITLGNGLISKPLKQFLAKVKPKEHWHLCLAGFPADPFGTHSQIIHSDPSFVLSKLAEGAYFQGETTSKGAKDYANAWFKESEGVGSKIRDAVSKSEWSDFSATELVLSQLPKESLIFLGNSMAIRYANWLSSHFRDSHLIYSNRGTSGIDGCVSTAVGLAKSQPDKPVIALVGDISFFYDRNGLWSQPIPPNLKIAVLNNGGGNIFRIIPGSGKVAELEDLFELNQTLHAKRTAEDAEMGYYQINGYQPDTNSSQVLAWINSPKAALLEYITNKYVNAEVVANLRKELL